VSEKNDDDAAAAADDDFHPAAGAYVICVSVISTYTNIFGIACSPHTDNGSRRYPTTDFLSTPGEM